MGKLKELIRSTTFILMTGVKSICKTYQMFMETTLTIGKEEEHLKVTLLLAQEEQVIILTAMTTR